MALRRGFKSEAERIARRLRQELDLPASSPISPDDIAEYLGIEVRAGDDLLPRDRFVELARIQKDAFSACTLNPTDGRIVVVYNPLSSHARRVSDVSHEIAHVVLKHELSRIERLGDFEFLSCDPIQEEEARWLSGTLLLPRELLLKEAWKGSTPSQIARKYCVSEQMARYRLNVTGVLKQINSRKPRRKAQRR